MGRKNSSGKRKQLMDFSHLISKKDKDNDIDNDNDNDIDNDKKEDEGQ